MAVKPAIAHQVLYRSPVVYTLVEEGFKEHNSLSQRERAGVRVIAPSPSGRGEEEQIGGGETKVMLHQP
jgi:hypothetical protein